MTDQQHPITPPPELVQQWWIEETYDVNTMYLSRPAFGVELLNLATKAAQWGADQELEACVNYIDNNMSGNKAREFRAIRRPKPPSLKEQALRILAENGTTLDGRIELEPEDIPIIRRALEQLND